MLKFAANAVALALAGCLPRGAIPVASLLPFLVVEKDGQVPRRHLAPSPPPERQQRGDRMAALGGDLYEAKAAHGGELERDRVMNFEGRWDYMACSGAIKPPEVARIAG